MSHLRKVLVVDDDINILAAFEDFLRKEHCFMIAAVSAEEGLKKLNDHHVDLLITDVRLEAQSGVTFLLNVVTDRPSLPVIVITGHPGLVTENEVKAYGADYYFVKPLELSKLRTAVRTCLHLTNN